MICAYSCLELFKCIQDNYVVGLVFVRNLPGLISIVLLRYLIDHRFCDLNGRENFSPTELDNQTLCRKCRTEN